MHKTSRLKDLDRLKAEGWMLMRYDVLEERSKAVCKGLHEVEPDLELNVFRPDMGNKYYIDLDGIRLIVEDGKITGWYESGVEE